MRSSSPHLGFNVMRSASRGRRGSGLPRASSPLQPASALQPSSPRRATLPRFSPGRAFSCESSLRPQIPFVGPFPSRPGLTPSLFFPFASQPPPPPHLSSLRPSAPSTLPPPTPLQPITHPQFLTPLTPSPHLLPLNPTSPLSAPCPFSWALRSSGTLPRDGVLVVAALGILMRRSSLRHGVERTKEAREGCRGRKRECLWLPFEDLWHIASG